MRTKKPAKELTIYYLELFCQKFTKDESGCWIWQGYTNFGYGAFKANQSNYRAHRITYELYVGKVPQGLVLDHLCRNRACVNPAHLEAVKQRVNALRGKGITSINARKTECLRGHKLAGANLAVYKSPYGLARHCKACEAARDKERKRRNRVLRAELRAEVERLRII